MPIQLDAMQESIANIKSYDPKFFGSNLTGKGGKGGLLCESRNPSNLTKITKEVPLSVNLENPKSSYKNGDTTVSIYPLYVMPYSAMTNISGLKRPDVNTLEKLEFKQDPSATFELESVHLRTRAHSIITEERSSLQSKSKKVTICYEITFYMELAQSYQITEELYMNVIQSVDYNSYNTIAQALDTAVSRSNRERHIAITMYTCNPAITLEKFTDSIAVGPTFVKFDKVDVEDYVDTLSAYDLVCAQSELWKNTIHEELDEYFELVDSTLKEYAALGMSPTPILNNTARILGHIETYAIPLELYQSIYQAVKTRFTPERAEILCKQNLNLLLSDTLSNLHDNRDKLTCLPQTNVVPQGRFSKEQKGAIATTNPLVLVQAGAGTGKSTVILGRIEHMVNCGINPADITVLSFTNAAADNITAKNPNVHSMTIAKMVHLIYEANFPTHQLSTIGTIVNSLDIYYPNPPEFITKFKEKLTLLKPNTKNVKGGLAGAIVAVNNFVERNFDAVVECLDVIKQTSLELEILLCYHNIGNFIEPQEVQSKYLIIDEVQDNSIFEFIYTLKYVEKHQESLFIVGDCSQTLYEFRASNPKALNVLEGSGVFETHQLQVNYRSNQEILDFANVLLNDIDANQYANIQLKANSLVPVTAQSFKSKVTLAYKQLDKQAQFNQALPGVIITNAKGYIQDKINKNEKVAVLAYSRNHIKRAEKTLRYLFPNAEIANLMPDRMNDTLYFSTFIKKFWDEIKFLPPQNVMTTIAREVLDKIDLLVYSKEKQTPHVQKLLAQWKAEQGHVIDSWQVAHANGVITTDELLLLVKENMMKFEIGNNAARQALLSARNQINKDEDAVAKANIILSTVHSAKGLEFDHVIVIYEARNNLTEEKKRMYYVALTRAMKSELILAFDTLPKPKIETDYATIIKRLNEGATHASHKVRGSVNADGKVVVFDDEVEDDTLVDIAFDYGDMNFDIDNVEDFQD